MRYRGRRVAFGLAGVLFVAAACSVALPASASSAGAHGMATARVKGSRPRGGGTSNLSYHGGAVSAAPVVYLVFWGTQWSSGGDPSSEAAYLQRFYGGLFGSSDTWSTSTTQYCEGVALGTTNCASVTSSKTFVGHPSTSPLPAANV
jgi:hypothetical protein